jgi:hypothetical protein
MRPAELRNVLRAEPFTPVQIGLSDGRCVIVRHPDQAVVSERVLFVGLAKLERSKPLATPRTSDAIAKDWLMVNLLQVTSIEPANGKNGNSRRGKRR